MWEYGLVNPTIASGGCMFPIHCTENLLFNVIYVHACSLWAPQTCMVCACLTCDLPKHCPAASGLLWHLLLPLPPRHCLTCAAAFNCQSPGACEYCIYPGALSQLMQFYQTKYAIVIQDRWQVQKPMNARFLPWMHPHTEK